MSARVSSLISVVAFLLPVWSTAEDGDWDWIVSAEGDAVTRCIASDASGNVYVGGSFQSEISLDSLTLTAVNGTGDLFLLKLAEDGQVIWGRSAGGERLDRCWGVTWDAAGRVYIVGDFCSNSITFDTVTLENNYQTPYIDDSTFDVFTTCYDEDGTVLWARSAGGQWHDNARGIACDGLGGAYVLGTFLSSEIVFDTVSLTNTGNVDLFLARYDANGSVQWARNARGTGQENAWSLVVDSDDRVYIAGSYQSPTLEFDAHVLTNTSDNFDLYVAKFDPSGRVLWALSATGQEWDEATALAIDREDNIFLAGHYSSDTLSFDTTHLVLSNNEQSNIDMFLVKFDQDGCVGWATGSSGAAWVYPQSASVWNMDRIAITGSFTGNNFGDTEQFGIWPITTHGSYDILLVTYDVDGSPLSAENYGGTDMDFGQAVCRNKEGDLFLGAFFSSDTLSMGSTTLYNDHFNKMLIAKRLSSSTLVPGRMPGNGPVAERIVVRSTPNPFADWTSFSYRLEGDEHVRLAVFDLQGRLVCVLVDRFQRGGEHTVIWKCRDVGRSEPPSGAYIGRLRAGAQEGSRYVIQIR